MAVLKNYQYNKSHQCYYFTLQNGMFSVLLYYNIKVNQMQENGLVSKWSCHRQHQWSYYWHNVGVSNNDQKCPWELWLTLRDSNGCCNDMMQIGFFYF